MSVHQASMALLPMRLVPTSSRSNARGLHSSVCCGCVAPGNGMNHNVRGDDDAPTGMRSTTCSWDALLRADAPCPSRVGCIGVGRQSVSQSVRCSIEVTPCPCTKHQWHCCHFCCDGAPGSAPGGSAPSARHRCRPLVCCGPALLFKPRRLRIARALMRSSRWAVGMSSSAHAQRFADVVSSVGPRRRATRRPRRAWRWGQARPAEPVCTRRPRLSTTESLLLTLPGAR